MRLNLSVGICTIETAPPTEAVRTSPPAVGPSIRGGLERHFGVAPAFQNCHRVAAFRPEDRNGATYARFTSARSQILNQSPGFRDC